METRAGYLIVGSFVITSLLGIVLFFLWVVKTDFDYNLNFYDIYFPGSTTGLNVGGKVSYKGVPIGSVKKIQLDPKDLGHVRVTVGIQKKIPITEGVAASLEMQGLTGYSYIQISGGNLKNPLLKPKTGQPYAVIPAQYSPIEEIMTSLPKVVHKLSTLLDSFNDTFNTQNRKTFSEILRNSDIIAKSLAKGTDALLRDSRESLQAFTATANEITLTAHQFRSLLQESKPAIEEITQTGSYELIRTLNQMHSTINSLGRFLNRFDQNTQSLLFPSPQKGRDIRDQ